MISSLAIGAPAAPGQIHQHLTIGEPRGTPPTQRQKSSDRSSARVIGFLIIRSNTLRHLRADAPAALSVPSGAASPTRPACTSSARIPLPGTVKIRTDRRVAAIQLGDGLPAYDLPGVSGYGDDVFEDRVVGEQVEEVALVDEAGEALLDDAEERGQRREVIEVTDRRAHLPSCAGHARRAKSARPAGGLPVTL